MLYCFLVWTSRAAVLKHAYFYDLQKKSKLQVKVLNHIKLTKVNYLASHSKHRSDRILNFCMCMASLPGLAEQPQVKFSISTEHGSIYNQTSIPIYLRASAEDFFIHTDLIVYQFCLASSISNGARRACCLKSCGTFINFRLFVTSVVHKQRTMHKPLVA